MTGPLKHWRYSSTLLNIRTVIFSPPLISLEIGHFRIEGIGHFRIEDSSVDTSAVELWVKLVLFFLFLLCVSFFDTEPGYSHLIVHYIHMYDCFIFLIERCLRKRPKLLMEIVDCELDLTDPRCRTVLSAMQTCNQ